MMGAGNSCASMYNSNPNLPTFGGSKKQGVVSRVGNNPWANREYQINANGIGRTNLFLMNQLGGVGVGRSMFNTRFTQKDGLAAQDRFEDKLVWTGTYYALTKDHTITEGDSFSHTYHLHVPENVTLTVHGKMLSPSISLAGVVVVHGSHVHGGLSILKSGRYVLHGHAMNARRPEARAINTTDTTNTGVFIVNTGATYTNNNTFKNSGYVYVYGTFVNNDTYKNNSTTFVNGTFNNFSNVNNLDSFTINGTGTCNNYAEFINGDGNAAALLSVYGILNNENIIKNSFKSKLLIAIIGVLINQATLNNFSNLFFIYGTLRNGVETTAGSVSGTIVSSYGCSITLYGDTTYTGNLDNVAGTINTYQLHPTYGGNAAYDDIIFSGGTLTGNITRTIQPPKWRLIYDLTTSTYIQFHLDTSQEDADPLYKDGVSPSYLSTLKLLSSDSFYSNTDDVLLTKTYTNKHFIQDSNLQPNKKRNHITLQVPTSWFSSVLVEGNGYTIDITLTIINSINQNARTWFPFIYSPP
jgi:hypothetical protein